MVKFVGCAIAVLTLFGILFSTYQFAEKRYAQAADIKQIEQRLDYKIISDQVDRKEERILQLEKRYPKKSVMPESVEEEYNKAVLDKVRLQRQLEILERHTK